LLIALVVRSFQF